jgi:hypothetical protein
MLPNLPNFITKTSQARHAAKAIGAYKGLAACEQTPEIATDGSQRWYSEGRLHRVDGPALIHANGTSYWYRHGRKHRDDGPAVEYPSGQKEWYRDGMLYHLETPDHAHCWYQDGRRHRVDGPAVVRPDGERRWFLNGCPCDEIRPIVPTLQDD